MELISYFDNNLIVINIFDLFFISNFFFLFYVRPRNKVWIELLDLSDSLKYFIPSSPISLSVRNSYSKKKKD